MSADAGQAERQRDLADEVSGESIAARIAGDDAIANGHSDAAEEHLRRARELDAAVAQVEEQERDELLSQQAERRREMRGRVGRDVAALVSAAEDVDLAMLNLAEVHARMLDAERDAAQSLAAAGMADAARICNGLTAGARFALAQAAQGVSDRLLRDLAVPRVPANRVTGMSETAERLLPGLGEEDAA